MNTSGRPSIEEELYRLNNSGRLLSLEERVESLSREDLSSVTQKQKDEIMKDIENMVMSLTPEELDRFNAFLDERFGKA